MKIKVVALASIFFLMVIVVSFLFFTISKEGYSLKEILNPSSSREKNSEKQTSSNLKLSAIPQEIAVITSSNTSDTKELKIQYELADSIAVTTNTLDLSNCDPKPAVMKVNLGERFTVINPNSLDATERAINFGPNQFWIIPPNQSVSIIANFGNKQSIHKYGCNIKKGNVGIILIGS